MQPQEKPNVNRGFESNHEARILAQAYERACSGRGQEEIEMKDFVGVYGEERVKKNIAEVERLEELFAQRDNENQNETKKRAEVLEAIVAEQVELNLWFGPAVTTRKASRYDDYKNGVDIIAHIERGGRKEHLALAIDVTHGEGSIDEKFHKIKQEIDTGTLTEIEYFEDSEGNRGPKKGVARVVIGVGAREVNELAELWVEGKKRALAVHPVQIQFLEEMEWQLEAFRDYARALGSRVAIADEYDKQLKIVREILSDPQKQALKQEADELQDRTQNTIRRKSRVFKMRLVGKS